MTAISWERLEIHSLPFVEKVPFGFWEGRVRELHHPELSSVFVLPTREEAARFVAEKILDIVHEKPDAAISFPTGNQAKSVYEHLAKRSRERGVSFDRVQAYHLDEYFPISTDHPDSFRKYLRENVWGPLGLKPENIHEIPADPGSDGAKVAADYEALLANIDIDLVLHPIGCGGHMAFDEAGTPKDSVTHLADLSSETVFRDHVERGQTSPEQAITQGIATIMRAKKIIFIDFDEKYAADMHAALFGDISDQNPSSHLRSIGNTVEVVITEAIANSFPQNDRPARA